MRVTGDARLDAMGKIGGLDVMRCYRCFKLIVRNGHIQRHKPGFTREQRMVCSDCSRATRSSNGLFTFEIQIGGTGQTFRFKSVTGIKSK